jgi:enoyl-CoA hydratase/carnithine racemase
MIGWIILDHPERKNALSESMWGELADAARQLDQNAEVRAVVLRGAGEEAFASGADISEFEQHDETETSVASGSENAFLELERLSKPLIAMVHGYCIGGGLAVALTADMRYASEDASFAIPAARLGLGYDMEGIEELARLAGISCAKEILFSARRYSAAEALEMGLVNKVLPAPLLEDYVRKMAERIAGNAPLTLKSVKLIARELCREPSLRDMKAVESSLAACDESEDYREGVAAFLSKRSPRFRGR